MKTKAVPASPDDDGDYEPSESDREDHKPEVEPEGLIVGGEVAPGPPSAVTRGFDGEPSDIEVEDGEDEKVLIRSMMNGSFLRTKRNVEIEDNKP